MEALEIFLEALERRLQPTSGHFIMKKNAYNLTSIKAYKTYSVEVYLLQSGEPQLVAKAEETGRATNSEEIAKLKRSICKQSIEQLLKHYGI